MRFGCCFSLLDDDILLLGQAGADYAETAFSALAELTPEQAWERSRRLEAAGISVPVMNVMFPGGLPLTGDQVNYQKIDEYLDRTLEKAALFGVKKVVFGSGAARRVPEGFSREKAFEQLVTLCRDHISPAFEQRDMVCCIEPLQQGECNIVNTCSEGFRLAKAADRPGIRLLVDLYHFDLEREKLSSLGDYKGFLCHAHIASAKNSREIPQDGDGENYRAFFRALRQAGYDGEVSLEGTISGGLPEIAASISYLKSQASEPESLL